MKKHTKQLIACVAVIMIIVCASFGLTACNLDGLVSKQLNYLADQMALIMLGNDAYSWNVFSVDPAGSYGYELDGNSKWYSYSSLNDSDVEDVYYAFEYFGEQLQRINIDKLSGKDIATYYTLQHTIDTYLDYYGGGYAKEFALMSGDYISSQGGYVADFTSAVENYAFRNQTDIENLLSIVRSANSAFESYLKFARDRANSNHPLYDYTINAMQEYLDEILEQGDDYYLYSFINRKLDAVDFLPSEQIGAFKLEYKIALKNSFMQGVKTLKNGLDEYKGKAVVTNKSYLASYGNAGKAYYEWSFRNKTGLSYVNMTSIYSDLCEFYTEYAEEAEDIIEYVNSLAQSNPTLYAEFNAYLEGEKQILDLTDPEEILAYVKEAAKQLVPELKNEPTIDFKYMDDTVAKRTMTLAYYLRSPMDETNSTEHITLNPYYIENSPSDQLLPTIAHEGYPGHLYAAVNAKEQGVSLLTGLNTVSAFVEGWAVYTQLAILNIIADTCNNQALSLYCDYLYNDTVAGYILPIIYDMQINYYGYSVDDLVDSFEMSEERARTLVETLMEMPVTYVSYGYGAYAMINLHNEAKEALGGRYNEVEFNSVLLSDGMGPTLDRAMQIMYDYVSRKSK